MTKYVDADALWQSLPNDLPYKAAVRRVLIQAQAADVVPWKWLKDYAKGKRTNYCSDWVLEAKDAYCKQLSCCNGNFCPDCGAEMVTDCHQLEEEAE